MWTLYHEGWVFLVPLPALSHQIPQFMRTKRITPAIS